ncbi:MAG: glycosyltransferase family 4 protein [Pseudomonadales bacterium]|nr:glycosyltransferase family 4 protein [Pseudomonadales bacterium]MDP4640871.1 glycosyltransferase family 4 protein [Pseudomonadales bacterium]
MKTAISACAADAGKSGIGQYIYAILGRLDALSTPDTEFVIYTEADNTAALAFSSARIKVQLLSPFWSRTLPNLFWHLLVLPLLLWRGNFNQVIFLAANRRLAWTPGVPSMGVVHDLSQLHIKGKYDRFRTFYVLHLLTGLMRRLDHVVCVSAATAVDVVDYAGVARQRVETIHNGADTSQFTLTGPTPPTQAGFPALGITRPYILYTARLEHPGKNHVGLLRAFAILRQHYQQQCNMPLTLVFAGARWTGAAVIDAEIERLGLSNDVHITGFVDQTLLPSLVRQASLFVMPSLFEGFGIPLVEAMAAGTPVCASRISSMPEVVGDAGLLFDPHAPQEMAQIMRLVLESPTLAAEMIARGSARARLFSWDTATKALVTASARLAAAAAGQPGLQRGQT